jgi:hypothetical protein
MSNSTAPIFMETIDKLGAGYLFGLTAGSKPALMRSLSSGSRSSGSSSTGSAPAGSPYTESPSARSPYVKSPSARSPYAESASVRSPYAESLSAGSPYDESLSAGSPYDESPSAGSPYAEPRAETTERLRLVAARSGEPADLRDYLTALATAVPAMSADNCRLVAGLLGVGVAPAFRESGPPRQP